MLSFWEEVYPDLFCLHVSGKEAVHLLSSVLAINRHFFCSNSQNHRVLFFMQTGKCEAGVFSLPVRKEYESTFMYLCLGVS